jgi:plastocyanin
MDMEQRGSFLTHGASQGWRRTLVGLGLLIGLLSPVGAETEQVVEVTIRNNAFITNQVPLQLNVPTLITVHNEDGIRHDFGSTMFQNSMTRVENDGVIPYGRGLDGVYLDGGSEASIRFTIERPGRFEFRCSIHPEMKGEILLMTAGSV